MVAEVDDREVYRRAAAAVFAAEPVVVAYLYGSRARGSHRPDSDVDVAVLLDDSVPATQYLARSLRYARELQARLLLPVDAVIVLNQAPLRLALRVLQDQVPLHVADDDARVQYESAIVPMAMDFELKAAQLDRLLLAAYAAGQR